MREARAGVPPTARPDSAKRRRSAADLDGDGRTDVAFGPIAGAGPNITRILLQRPGSGALGVAKFEPIEIALPTGGFPIDVDQDGDIDLVGEWVARGTRRHGAQAGWHRQYGTGTPGEADAIPVLGLRGQARSGAWKHLTLTNVTGPTIALLAFNTAPTDLRDYLLPGLNFFVEPRGLALATWLLPSGGEGRAAGEAEWRVPLPPGIAGLDLYEQVFVADPAAASGVAASNGLYLRVGN